MVKIMIKKSLREEEEEQITFNKFIKEFGIDKNAERFPHSPYYEGTLLTEKQVLGKMVKLGMISKYFIGWLQGKIKIFLHSNSWIHFFKDPESYFGGYYFKLIDKHPNYYRLMWTSD